LNFKKTYGRDYGIYGRCWKIFDGSLPYPIFIYVVWFRGYMSSEVQCGWKLQFPDNICWKSPLLNFSSIVETVFRILGKVYYGLTLTRLQGSVWLKIRIS
jgi:hypothetical protein